MITNEGKVRVTRVQLRNFKGFSSFSLKLEPMTILVGPNNAGKSTIVGAFRALSVALRTARTRKPEVLHLEDGNHRGYRIATDAIPISLENAQHNYSDEDAVATFTLSNRNRLRLIFPPQSGCLLVADPDDAVVRSTTGSNDTSRSTSESFPFSDTSSTMSKSSPKKRSTAICKPTVRRETSGTIGT